MENWGFGDESGALVRVYASLVLLFGEFCSSVFILSVRET